MEIEIECVSLKDIIDKLMSEIEIVEDKEDGGFVVKHKKMPGCLTCGESKEEAINNMRDAMEMWLLAVKKDKKDSYNSLIEEYK